MGVRRGGRGALAPVMGALTALVVLGGGLAASPAQGEGAAVAPPGAHQVLLGASPAGAGGNTRWTGVTTLETTLGRQLGFVRVFEVWDAAYPATFHTNVTSSDRVMALSVRARRTDGTVIPWADIATMEAGSPLEQELQTWITRMIDIGKPVWFNFNHEPELGVNAANGTSADYIAAWRRIVTEFRARGATNVKFAWIVTGNSFEVAPTDARYGPTWYPGDDYVDFISGDIYNWSSCRGAGAVVPWRSFESLTANFRAFAAAHPDKRVLITELGSPEQGGDKAAWFAEIQELLKQPGYEQVAGLGYFNKADAGYPACQFQIESSPEATAAFVALAQDPFFGGPADPVAPTATLTAPADGATVSDTVTLTAGAARGTMPLASVSFRVDGDLVGTDADGSDGFSTTWDTTSVANGQVTVTATATDTWGLTGTDAASVTVGNVVPPPPPPPVVHLVVAKPRSLSAGEVAVRNRLTSLGYDVRATDDDTVTAAGVSGSAFVIIGQSVTQTRAATALRGSAVTLWAAKPTLFDELRLTPAATSNYGTSKTRTIAVTAANHPLAGGRSGSVTFLTAQDAVSWGRPTSGAKVVATVSGRPAVFVYRAGRPLANGASAPGCRLTFPLFGTAPTRHTAAAWAMFDATVAYAARGC